MWLTSFSRFTRWKHVLKKSQNMHNRSTGGWFFEIRLYCGLISKMQDKNLKMKRKRLHRQKYWKMDDISTLLPYHRSTNMLKNGPYCNFNENIFLRRPVILRLRQRSKIANRHCEETVSPLNPSFSFISKIYFLLKLKCGPFFRIFVDTSCFRFVFGFLSCILEIGP